MKRVAIVVLCGSLAGLLIGGLFFRALRAQESSRRTKARVNADARAAASAAQDQQARDNSDAFDPFRQSARAAGQTEDQSTSGPSADAFEGDTRIPRKAGSGVGPGADSRPSVDFTRDRAGGSAATGAPRLREARRAYEEAEARVKELASMLQDPRPGLPGLKVDADSLRKAVARAFEARQKLLELEIADFQARLDALSKRFAERNKAANEVIDRRVQELLHPNLRWDDEGDADAPASNQRQPGRLPGENEQSDDSRVPGAPEKPARDDPSAAVE